MQYLLLTTILSITHLLSNLEFIYDVKCKSYHELKKSWEEKALLNILFKALDQCCPPRQLLTEEVKNTILNLRRVSVIKLAQW